MIYGNLKQQEILRSVLLKNISPILITGPDGVGKFSAVNYIFDSFKKEILKNEKIEKIVIKTDKEILQLQTIDFLISLSLRKTKKRFIIIDEAHKILPNSQNVLLKTLENYSSENIFILITHRENKILPTIRSRSFKIQFNLLSQEETKKFLLEKGFKNENINLAMEFYPYQPGKAYNFLISKKYKFIDKINLLSYENLNNLKKIFTLKEFIEVYILLLRKKFFEKIRNNQIDMKFIYYIKNCLELYNDADYNLNFDLQIANLLLKNE
jgi:hypothetical protein